MLFASQTFKNEDGELSVVIQSIVLKVRRVMEFRFYLRVMGNWCSEQESDLI